MSIMFAGARHIRRPLFQIMARRHVLLITEENLPVIVDVVAQMLLVAALRHALLFYNRHSVASPFQIKIIFIFFRVDDEDAAAFRLMLERGHASPIRKSRSPFLSMSCFAADLLYASPP